MFFTAARNAPPPRERSRGGLRRQMGPARARDVYRRSHRAERRDMVDVVTVHETILPLGAPVWAAVEKSRADTRLKG